MQYIIIIIIINLLREKEDLVTKLKTAEKKLEDSRRQREDRTATSKLQP